MRLTRHRLRAALAVALALPSVGAAQRPARDVLQGTVRGDSGATVPNASITITPAGAGATASLTTRSNDVGRWSLTMPGRAAEYFVTISAIGWTQTRFVAKADTATGPLVVDATLKRIPVPLAQVNVTADRRPPAARDGPVQPDVAATERGVLANSFAFAPSDAGNLAAMAAQVPGVAIIPDPNGGAAGISMFGLSPSQTSITLNGMQTGAGDVPRDLIGLVRITGAPYDVSRGGFSGALLSVNQVPGQNNHIRFVHLSYDGPALQSTDAVGRQLGQRYSNVQLSGSGAGPLVFNKLWYNVTFQGGRRRSDLASLLQTDAGTLQRLGVASDSVDRLRNVAALQGIPLAPESVPSDRRADNGSVLARVDWAPDSTTNANLVVSYRRSQSTASFVTPTAVPGHGGDVNRTGLDISAFYSGLIRGSILADWRLGVRTDNTASTPYVDLPDARVIVTSRFTDNTTGISSLLFGGNALLPRDSRTTGYEFLQQTTWSSVNNAHRWRATFNARVDRESQRDAANARGTFTYYSLADFQAGQPASFTRSFVSQNIAPEVQTGAISLGDQWRPTQNLAFSYGVRVDGSRATTGPARNGQVDSLFGVRTDYAPREVHASPRASFSWGFGRNGTTGIPGFGAPWGFLQGGIGEFRNDIRPGLMTPVLANTGLADGIRQITCVGSAVPAADWTAFEADPTTVPSACAPGTSSSFSTGRPNVFLVAPGFQSPRAWRGNLTLRGPLFFKLIRFSADALYSVNIHQQGLVDLNFVPTARGSVANEGMRPLFVAPVNVVPGTGAMTNADSRSSGALGAVNAITSDLRGATRQYTLVVNPIAGAAAVVVWSVSYTNSRFRDQTRGFGGGTTAGDPLAVEWGRAATDTRHAFNLNFYTRVSDLFSIALTGRAVSGLPFTPVVSGDVNGDGLANDRAFVFAPTASGADEAVAAEMRTLLAGASPRVRRCLTAQAGRMAARNSCEGPWTASMVGSLNLNPARLGYENRTSVTLSFTNPLVGIDQLLHGSARMHGWGQPAIPDPTLLRVRGFDASTNAFRYEVNPRFGDTRLASSATRAPFVVTFEVRHRLGRDFERQTTEQVLAPGRTRKGDRMPAPQTRARLAALVPNPLRGLLQVKDSLNVLSQGQIEQLTIVQRRLAARQDSIWTPLTTYLSGLEVAYDEAATRRRVHEAVVAAYDVMVEEMVAVSKILTPEQIEDFPPGLRGAFDIRQLRLNRPVVGFIPGY